MEIKKINFNFYGVKVSLTGSDSAVEKIYLDFKYFADINSSGCDIHLNVNIANPPYEKVPPVCASMYKSDCISYDKDGIRYVDYYGKALAVYNIKNNSAEFFSADEDLLHEIAYLFMHSRVGELLDKKGMHRIHACSFSLKNNTYIVMLPQGGGKSTLLTELLKNTEIKLISDDTPLIDTKGNVFAFPIRIGVHNDVNTEHIPAEYLSVFERRKFGQKKLISYEFFKERVEKRQLPAVIICGVRCFSGESGIIKTGVVSGFLNLFKNCVIGYGLPQVLEYFLTGGIRDAFFKTKIVCSRLYACIKLLIKHKKIYLFYISNNKSANADLFIQKFTKS